MKRNSGNQNRFPGYYRHDLLEFLRITQGLSLRDVAEGSGVKLDSARRVFLGEAHQKQVWPVAQFFKVQWKALHDLYDSRDLSLIARSSLEKAVRSSGPAPVGVRRPAP